MTPDFSQITAETISKFRYAGGNLSNRYALWEFHNKHKRGLPKGERADVDAHRAERFAQITAILKTHGPQTAMQISEHMQIDKSKAGDWLLRMHTNGVVNRKSKPTMGTGGYVMLYSAKSTPRATLVDQATQHASKGQNMGVSYAAE